MSITLTKAPARQASAASFGAPGLPQVNLLPPEVRAARGLVHVKRWLAVGFAIVLVVIGLVYAFALLQRSAAEKDLEKTQATTASLQAETSKYAEVPQVLGDLKRINDARAIGTSTEIQWKPYIDAITATLPANVSIDAFSVTSATPWTPQSTLQDPLVVPGTAMISFTARATALPDDAAWLDALNTIPNVTQASLVSAEATVDTGDPYYAITANVQVSVSAVVPRAPIATPEG